MALEAESFGGDRRIFLEYNKRMDEKEILDQIAAEDYDSEDVGPFAYGDKPKSAPKKFPPTYKIWNRNPSNPSAEPTPGIVMIHKTPVMQNGKRVGVDKAITTTESVRAVILFSSPGRELGRGSGKNFKVVCSSHDGVEPSLRIAEPLCRHTTAQDVANVFSQWKGYDEAKVDAKTKEVTEGTGQLQICGLKSQSGLITLCPFAKKDPLTGQRAACKNHIYMVGYDIERKCEFEMRLTGGSIDYGNFISPYHVFFKFLRLQGPIVNDKPKGLPCYAFSVTLSPLARGNFYILNVTDWKPIEQAQNRQEMKVRAEEAKERYNKMANWTPKPPEVSSVKPHNAEPAPVAEPTVQPPAVAGAFSLKDQVSFDEDDIPF